MTGLLAGIRVLDLCQVLAGPYATLTLAWLGADVIKLEDPDRPDPSRLTGPCFLGEQSLYFAALNSGKRSLAVRLATREGRRVVHDLVQHVDVVVDNFRPGVTAKLGMADADLRPLNPALITCSLTAFGETGPQAQRPGYDYTVQALTGVMALAGEPGGPPVKAGISYVDHSAGLAAALAVCAALVERGRTGVGRHIDLGLLDVQVSMLSYLASWSLTSGYVPERFSGGAHPSLVPAQIFVTADGWLSIFIGNDSLWSRLVGAMEDERLAAPRFATAQGRLHERLTVVETLRELFLKRPTREWVELLVAAGVPVAPVNDLQHALAEVQVADRGLVTRSEHPVYGAYRHVSGPLPSLADGPLAPAPTLGEHTRELLADIGREQPEIDRLLAEGTIVG
jgi:crotonobetainyl-CoA:carnitine CoA-transferase CaiB-like acyl-CoA transferase